MTAPLCRYCGKPIPKATRVVWLHPRPLTDHEEEDGGAMWRHVSVEELPCNLAECQRLTNQQILQVRYGTKGSITHFHEWDGKSYKDQYFCKGDCAKRFGYVAARRGEYTTAYEKASEGK
jgi:hypothetical protein